MSNPKTKREAEEAAQEVEHDIARSMDSQRSAAQQGFHVLASGIAEERAPIERRAARIRALLPTLPE